MKKSRLKDAIASFAGDLFEAPSDDFSSGWSVTVTDGAEAYVRGCRGILSYGEDEIAIDAGDVLIRVGGSGLDIVRYAEREIVVRGRVASFSAEAAGC